MSVVKQTRAFMQEAGKTTEADLTLYNPKIKAVVPEPKPKKEARVITLEDINNKDSGWAYPDQFEGLFGAKRHFFTSDVTFLDAVSASDCLSLCGKSKRIDKLEPDRYDKDWDNCKLCLRSLKSIRRKTNVQ